MDPPAAKPLADIAEAARKGIRESGIAAAHELLPVMEPEFNLREIAKQMILLELHLAIPRQRCNDCIRKHFATIEALAEEGASLGAAREGYEAAFAEIAEFARVWQARIAQVAGAEERVRPRPAGGFAAPAGEGGRPGTVAAVMRDAATAIRALRKRILKLGNLAFFDGKRYRLAAALALET